MVDYPLINTVKGLPASVPFVGPEAQERINGRPFLSRLGANENGFGPSPKAIDAMQKAATEIWMYGDPESFDLREKLAEFHGVGIENIVVDSGIDALLGIICRLYVEPGRQVVTSAGAYPTFNFHVSGNGGSLHFVPLLDDHENLQVLNEEALGSDAVLTYVSNPNNPMGSWQAAGALEAMIEKLPDRNVLVLDEAYVEFAPDHTAPPIDVSNPKVLRLRTFSKAYGLAGARVGYCIGEAGHICQFEKIRNHFGMNRVAQIGALAAQDDQEYLISVLGKVEMAREKIAAIATHHNFVPLLSAANFVAIDCMRDEVYANSIVSELAKRDVFIRMPGVAPQSRCIRVSVGPDDALNYFADVLGEVVVDLG